MCLVCSFCVCIVWDFGVRLFVFTYVLPSSGLLVSKSRGHQSSATDPLALIYDNAPKPTRFEWPEEELSAFNPLDSTFDDISYTSRPLLTREDEERARAAAGTSDDGKRSPSPEGRRMDVDDIKDYVKEQKIRLDFEDEESADNDLVSKYSFIIPTIK